MLFNSYIFILFFLPVTLVGYFMLNHIGNSNAAKIELLGMSLLFYGYFNYTYLPIICVSIVGNWILSRIAIHKRNIAKQIIAIGVISNLSMIFYFKYMNFFIENMNLLFKSSFMVKEILLPLGISFFTFQQISYLVDSYHGETSEYTFLEYAMFVTFFPQLIAGPIVLHDEIIPQFKEKENWHINADNISKGIYIFAVGLFKKVIVADTFNKAVIFGFGNIESLTSIEAAIVMLSYTFQIYFDFSGYCDMAAGIASMFNINLPINFNSPYKALSIIEFWQRWHMTLTRFLRKYVYFPLGGGRKGKRKKYLNILIVFLISGLWHGANWTFLLWGLMHGIANVATRLLGERWERLHKGFKWIVTFIFINITWIFFRADSITQAIALVKKIFVFNSFEISEKFVNCFQLVEFKYFINKCFPNVTAYHANIFAMLVFIIVALIMAVIIKNCHEKNFKPRISNGLLTIFLMFWSVISLSGISAFLYFNF